MNTLFCFGFGYVCAYLTDALMRDSDDWQVLATTRRREKQVYLKEKNIKTFRFHEDKPLTDPIDSFRDVTHVLLSIPPNDDGDLVLHHHEQEILANMPNLKWIGYLSSTSVYGDKGGDWVDETSEKEADSKRGSRRVKAEEKWLSLKRKHDLPVHIFRLSGIYGPGRSAIDTVRAGSARRIDKPGHAFSRIHVRDIVTTLRRSMENPKRGAIYNVGDDAPAPSHEVLGFAYELLGKDVPPLIPFDEAHMSPMLVSFYRNNKRIMNDKIKKELGVNLAYPTYKIGLQACLEEDMIDLAVPSDSL